MYPQEIEAINETFAHLTKAVASQQPHTSFTTNHVDAIIQILDRWPVSQRFPGMSQPQPYLPGKQTISSTPEVIDLSRLVTGYCPDLCSSPSLRETFLDALFVGSGWPTDGSWSLPLSKAQETNILLLLRTIANVFQEGAPIHEGVWVTKVRW